MKIKGRTLVNQYGEKGVQGTAKSEKSGQYHEGRRTDHNQIHLSVAFREVEITL